MKKRFLHIVAFFALAAGLSLTSCTKEDPAEAFNISSLETGTINGIAYAKLDATSTAVQFAPQGTTIFLTVDYSQFGNNSGVYQASATVGANGTFTFNAVPTKNGGAFASIAGDGFKATYTVSTSVTETRSFESASGSAKVMPSGTSFVTINYGSGSLFQ